MKEKWGTSLGAQLFTVIALSMVFFFPAPFPKCLITNMLSWSFFALNPQMESVTAWMLPLQLTRLIWRAVVSVPDSFGSCNNDKCLKNQSQVEGLLGLPFLPRHCPKQIWDEHLIPKQLWIFSLVGDLSGGGGGGRGRLMFSCICEHPGGEEEVQVTPLPYGSAACSSQRTGLKCPMR